MTYTRCGLFVVVWHNYHHGSLLGMPKHLNVTIGDAAWQGRLRRCRGDRRICEVVKDMTISINLKGGRGGGGDSTCVIQIEKLNIYEIITLRMCWVDCIGHRWEIWKYQPVLFITMKDLISNSSPICQLNSRVKHDGWCGGRKKY